MNTLLRHRFHLLSVSAFLLASGSFAPSVDASALYRCKDKNGVTAYTSSQAGYHQCRMVGNFPAEKAKSEPAPALTLTGMPSMAAESSTPGPKVEFRTAVGGAEPKAAESGGAKPKVTRGAVYKYEKNGVTHYTNRRPSAQAQVLFSYIETCFACGAAPGLDFNNVGLNMTAFAEEVAAASELHGVDEALVRAVIHAESAFNPNAISRAGAQGLMQLMPATASRFGVTDPFAPHQNINGGVSYLAWLTKRFDGDFNKIAAGYNAGEGAVDRFGGIPPYQETIVYVERVSILRDRYRQELLAKSASERSSAAPGATSASEG